MGSKLVKCLDNDILYDRSNIFWLNMGLIALSILTLLTTIDLLKKNKVLKNLHDIIRRVRFDIIWLIIGLVSISILTISRCYIDQGLISPRPFNGLWGVSICAPFVYMFVLYGNILGVRICRLVKCISRCIAIILLCVWVLVHLIVQTMIPHDSFGINSLYIYVPWYCLLVSLIYFLYPVRSGLIEKLLAVAGRNSIHHSLYVNSCLVLGTLSYVIVLTDISKIALLSVLPIIYFCSISLFVNSSKQHIPLKFVGVFCVTVIAFIFGTIFRLFTASLDDFFYQSYYPLKQGASIELIYWLYCIVCIAIGMIVPKKVQHKCNI